MPITGSLSPNLVEEPFLFCTSDPHHIVASFAGGPASLASESKARWELVFADFLSTKK